MLMADVPTWEKHILPIVLPSMAEADNFSDHPLNLKTLHVAGTRSSHFANTEIRQRL
jgi:hypothetical protein